MPRRRLGRSRADRSRSSAHVRTSSSSTTRSGAATGSASASASSSSPTPPGVILYSGYVDDVFAVPAALAQADAIVPKSAPVDVLLDALRDVASGRPWPLRLDPDRIQAASARLSDRDLPILGMLFARLQRPRHRRDARDDGRRGRRPSAADHPRHAGHRPGAQVIPAVRDSVNDLYDSACELLDAAHRLRRAAARPGSVEALAPTMGCLEAVLRELVVAQAELDRQAARREVKERRRCRGGAPRPGRPRRRSRCSRAIVWDRTGDGRGSRPAATSHCGAEIAVKAHPVGVEALCRICL